MSATATLTITAVSKDGKSVKVGDEWMKVSNYSKVKDPQRGKKYEGKVSEYKGTKYVSLFKELSEGNRKSNGKTNGRSSDGEITKKDKIIARMNALRTAGELMQIKPPEVENFDQVKQIAVETAEQLLKWILMEE